MAKPSAKEVTTGMIFEVVSQDPELHFGLDLSTGMTFSGTHDIHIATGTRIEVTKAPFKPSGGGRLVNFKKVGDTKEYSSFWSVFRNNTQLISGTPAFVPALSVTSTGAFAGFDLKIHNVEFDDFTAQLGFAQIKIFVEFLGTFTGKSKMNTKLINQIKNSPGFKDEILKLIDAEFVGWRPTIDTAITHLNKKASYFSSQYDRRMVTWYSGGKLLLELCIMDDYTTFRRDMERLIDVFIQAKSTNTCIN